MYRKTLFLILFICLFLTAACSRQTDQISANASTGTLTVMAAASLTEAYTEIGRLFESQYPGVRVVFNYAGSQQLAQQLVQGAPADVFASADQRNMDSVVQAERVAPDSVRLFASNRLVVIYPADNPAILTALTNLANPGLKIILTAPEAPIGQYSLEFLDKAAQDPAFPADFRESVLANVVSYENNVKAVLTKVSLGEADAGIVYISDAVGAVGQLEIPASLNITAVYPIAALQDSKNPVLAQAFVDLVLSAEGQEILARYGFLPVMQ
jgi:molybdate transport system substrate-binding protein